MTVDVCGIPFSIDIAKSPFRSGTQFFGETDGKAASIVIHSACSPEQWDATLIHEWLHGVCQCYGCDDSEPMIAVIAQELYRVGFRVKTDDEKEKSK
jgi:hypothetical protein